MPHVSAVPAADRFFARLDRFECECPSCGRLIFSSLNKHDLPSRLQEVAHFRRDARYMPKRQAVWKAAWNPFSQRLACPWCGQSFVAGLILYPVRPRAHRPTDAPPDAVPTPAQLMEMRARAGGWLAREYHQKGQQVNQAIDVPCSCPERGWSVTCPVHGDPQQPAPAGAKVDQQEQQS